MLTSDRFNVHAQIEHLQSKYTGTGHSDTTKWEWGTATRRDTYASHVGHFSRMMYFRCCENKPIASLKNAYIHKLLCPCGPAPPSRMSIVFKELEAAGELPAEAGAAAQAGKIE